MASEHDPDCRGTSLTVSGRLGLLPSGPLQKNELIAAKSWSARSDKLTFSQGNDCRPDRNQGGHIHAKLLVEIGQLRSQPVLVRDFESVSRLLEKLERCSVAFGAAPILAAFYFLVCALWEPRLVNHQMHVFPVLKLFLDLVYPDSAARDRNSLTPRFANLGIH
jgi:hypothetical protein